MINPLHDWQAPIPLGANDVPPFPEGVFPDSVENFVDELSRSTETPRDLAGLTVASHEKYAVQVKADYQEPVNIWTAFY